MRPCAGTGHFVFTPVPGVDPNSPAPFMGGKGQMDGRPARERLRESGLIYTILASNLNQVLA